MQTTGSAVVNGAISTLIAALCLSGSASYVFLTFFFALLFIVLAGAFQGLVVLPVMLDLCRPAYHVTVQPQKETDVATTNGNMAGGHFNGGSHPV
jgi:Patched family